MTMTTKWQCPWTDPNATWRLPTLSLGEFLDRVPWTEFTVRPAVPGETMKFRSIETIAIRTREWGGDPFNGRCPLEVVFDVNDPGFTKRHVAAMEGGLSEMDAWLVIDAADGMTGNRKNYDPHYTAARHLRAVMLKRLRRRR